MYQAAIGRGVNSWSMCIPPAELIAAERAPEAI
jgi:hypothetical protein